MKPLLLDTHALLWWFLGHPNLSEPARDAIAGRKTPVLVSAVSAFEIATKHRLGKLPEAYTLVSEFEPWVAEQGFEPLPLELKHGRRAGALTIVHKDPFDRLLIAQALSDDLVLVSNETAFDRFGVSRLW